MDDKTQQLEQLFASTSRDACSQALEEIFSPGVPEAGAAIKVYLRNFASFNETFGYRQGEAFLRQAARFLLDIEGARVFRLGGGVSFVLLLPGVDPVRCTAAAQQIVDRFELPWQIGQMDCVCAVDVGAVLYPEYADTPDEVLRHLDIALAQSAREGQNQVTLFGPVLQERLYRNTVIARLLGTAVANGEIELRYRPTFCTVEGAYTRVECQARLLTVEFGPVKSSEFGPISEESGIVCFVNLHVLHRACETIRLLLDRRYEFESLSAQVSPVLFIQPGFADSLAELMERYRIPAGKLALEIHVNPLTAHASRAVVDRLRAMGVEIVLGNFDFGYVGIKNLLTLPLDAVKLGRLFIWQLETNPRSGPVIEGLIHTAKSLGVKLIAEGVETDQQNSLLSRYGCPYRQGFYYSPSVGLAELQELLPQKED